MTQRPPFPHFINLVDKYNTIYNYVQHYDPKNLLSGKKLFERFIEILKTPNSPRFVNDDRELSPNFFDWNYVNSPKYKYVMVGSITMLTSLIQEMPNKEIADLLKEDLFFRER